MRHDKTKVYFTTIVAVAAVVFLVTLFINTMKTIESADRETSRPPTIDEEEKPLPDAVSAIQEEKTSSMENPDGL